jgi:hypothetical protein
MPSAIPSQGANEDLMWGGVYAQDLFNHLFLEEATFLPRQDYMDVQNDINHKMRAILVDWLVDVQRKFRLRQETLFLMVNLMDRYLSRSAVVRKKLQLVGVASMFIATKFEEITPPEAVDLAYITDNAYSKGDILQMECKMLTTLAFQICVPTVVHFSDWLHHVNQSDATHREVARYLAELALVQYHMVRFLPSYLVAAATLLSNELFGRDPLWPAYVAKQARYTEDQLQICVDELRVLLEAAPKSSLQAVRRKYMLPQHHCAASMFTPEWTRKVLSVRHSTEEGGRFVITCTNLAGDDVAVLDALQTETSAHLFSAIADRIKFPKELLQLILPDGAILEEPSNSKCLSELLQCQECNAKMSTEQETRGTQELLCFPCSQKMPDYDANASHREDSEGRECAHCGTKPQGLFKRGSLQEIVHTPIIQTQEQIVQNPVGITAGVPKLGMVERTVDVPKTQIEEETIKVPKIVHTMTQNSDHTIKVSDNSDNELLTTDGPVESVMELRRRAGDVCKFPECDAECDISESMITKEMKVSMEAVHGNPRLSLAITDTDAMPAGPGETGSVA